MIKLLKIAILSSAFLSFSAYAAELKIAIVDVQGAIESSTHMGSIQKKLEEEFAPIETDLKLIANELAKLQDKLVKDAQIMGESELRRIQQELNQKKSTYQFEEYEAKRKLAARQQELSIPLLTLAEKAMQDIINEEKYDMVVLRQAVVHFKPEYDITKKLTERLNKQK